jgi:hypothetical protein
MPSHECEDYPKARHHPHLAKPVFNRDVHATKEYLSGTRNTQSKYAGCMDALPRRSRNGRCRERDTINGVQQGQPTNAMIAASAALRSIGASSSPPPSTAVRRRSALRQATLAAPLACEERAARKPWMPATSAAAERAVGAKNTRHARRASMYNALQPGRPGWRKMQSDIVFGRRRTQCAAHRL